MRTTRMSSYVTHAMPPTISCISRRYARSITTGWTGTADFSPQHARAFSRCGGKQGRGKETGIGVIEIFAGRDRKNCRIHLPSKLRGRPNCPKQSCLAMRRAFTSSRRVEVAGGDSAVHISEVWIDEMPLPFADSPVTGKRGRRQLTSVRVDQRHSPAIWKKICGRNFAGVDLFYRQCLASAMPPLHWRS